MKYDEIIEDVGGFGLYQKLLLAFLYVITVIDGMQFGIVIFLVPEIKHRCATPGLPSDTYDVQDTNYADPTKEYIVQDMEEEERQYRICTMYSNGTLDGNITIGVCHCFAYDKSQYQTLVTSDMNLVCDREIFTSHVKTAFFAGAFLMYLMGGWISDKFGRKVTIVSCVLIEGISSLVSSQVSNAYLFLFARFLSAVGGSGSFGTLLVYVSELVSMKYRSRQTLALHLGFPIAFLLISLMAYFIRVLRLLMIIIAVPSIPLALLTMWLMPESPRWLMSAKREKKAAKILNKMAEINKSKFRYEPEQEIEISNSNARTVKVWKMFTVPALLKRTLILMFNWMPQLSNFQREMIVLFNKEHPTWGLKKCQEILPELFSVNHYI